MQENPYSSPASNLGGRESYGSQAGVSHGIIGQLAGTKGWATLFGVLMMLIAGLLFIFAVTSMHFIDTIMQRFGVPMEILGKAKVVVGAICFIIGACLVAYGLLLTSFSSAIKQLIRSGRGTDLDVALDRQRRFWVVSGILAIIEILFSLLQLAGQFA